MKDNLRYNQKELDVNNLVACYSQQDLEGSSDALRLIKFSLSMLTSTNLKKAEELLKGMCKRDDRVRSDLGVALTSSNIDLAVSELSLCFWVKKTNYTEVYFDLLQATKNHLTRLGFRNICLM